MATLPHLQQLKNKLETYIVSKGHELNNQFIFYSG